METNVPIPEKLVNQKIIQFRVAPPSLDVQVYLQTPEGQKGRTVNITDLWAGATASQKTVIKVFFKRIGALALDAENEADGVDVVEGDVTGDIWD